MKKIVSALALSIALSGCSGEVTIDTSSVEALNSSVREITEELPPADRQRFQAAIETLIDAKRGDGRSLEVVAKELTPEINGKTAPEVIAAADAWVVAEEARLAKLERERTLSDLDGKINEYTAEIARLEKVIIEQNARVKKVLAEFSVSKPRFFWRGSGENMYPIIEFDVTNSHSEPIETVVVSAALMEEGRAEPLNEGQLRYEFPRRLQPDKTASVRFEPDVYGDWAKKELRGREDLKLSAEVANMTFVGGEELIRTYVFRGDDPVLQVENLKRRLVEAKTQRNALLEETKSSSS
ncbi:MAG TPA: DUF6694 family lipoprotein [Afifellaceae bacterium]|nr:DUF6694 family lipoprotein [Afifellaceae bacterium]